MPYLRPFLLANGATIASSAGDQPFVRIVAKGLDSVEASGRLVPGSLATPGQVGGPTAPGKHQAAPDGEFCDRGGMRMERRQKGRLAKLFSLPVLALCGFFIAATLAGVGLATSGTDSSTTTTTVPSSPCFDVVLENPSGPNKVSLCHFTGGTNFVLNMPSISALDPHTTHHGDCYKKFNEDQVCVT